MKPYACLDIMRYAAAAALLLFAAAAPAGVTNRHGPVELTMAVDPPAVRLERDLLLTLRVAAPTGTVVRLPDMADRLQGFALAGAFTRPAPAPAGHAATEYCYRLTPLIAEEYRLRPLPVAYVASEDLSVTNWFITAPVVLGRPPAGPAEVGTPLPPRRVMPPAVTFARWLFTALLLFTALWLVWRLVRRWRLAVELRRMSPRARALYELDSLLASNLLGPDRMKEFYAQLTLIVRRYIERAHAIRAPEQTTEEFLANVAADARFKPAVLARLRDFLQAADLVKFAAWQPRPGAVDRAVNTARDYIESE